MIETDIGVFGGRSRLQLAAQAEIGAAGIAIEQEADEIGDVLFRSGEPILQGEEIGAQILSGTRDELKDTRDAAQHRKLMSAAGGGRLAAAPQPLQEVERAPFRTVHIETADAGEFDDVRLGHAAENRVASLTTRLDRRMHRLRLLLHEQHRRDDDVRFGDRREAALQGRGIVPFGGGMKGEIEARECRSRGRGARDPPRPPNGCRA